MQLIKIAESSTAIKFLEICNKITREGYHLSSSNCGNDNDGNEYWHAIFFKNKNWKKNKEMKHESEMQQNGIR
jgi:hypothetical protein